MSHLPTAPTDSTSDNAKSSAAAPPALSRPFRDIVQEAVALTADHAEYAVLGAAYAEFGSSALEYWVGKAASYLEAARECAAAGNEGTERAFVNYAKAAVILRSVLPGLPGYADAAAELEESIAPVSAELAV